MIRSYPLIMFEHRFSYTSPFQYLEDALQPKAPSYFSPCWCLWPFPGMTCPRENGKLSDADELSDIRLIFANSVERVDSPGGSVIVLRNLSVIGASFTVALSGFWDNHTNLPRCAGAPMPRSLWLQDSCGVCVSALFDCRLSVLIDEFDDDEQYEC